MTFKHQLSADDVSLLSAAVQFSAGVTYDDGVLFVESSDENDLIAEALAQIEDLRKASFDVIKDEAKRTVDLSAEECRQKFMTPGSGQAMTYQLKAAEAQAYLASSNPKSSDYPMLSAEIGITGETLTDVAMAVRAAFEQWQTIGARIEAVRLTAKAAISVADTNEEIKAVFETIAWP